MLFLLLAAGMIAFGLPRLVSELYALKRIVNPSTMSERPVAIIFGAGLQRDGSPTEVLRDRVATGADLYFSGKVKKLLMSGDNRFENYNEPGAMRAYALELGVPDGDIILDYAGRRTYDTCYRAKAIFGIQQAVLVTQRFHLPRALVICNGLGLDGVGVSADRRTYHQYAQNFWNLREFPATLMAFVDTFITRPLPVQGNKEKIFPDHPDE
ncbi:MAG TPA: ElyC/SanA/YdcF family protein [Longilinea sp.]|nr:ElyC/SanA/YdcF family protein [Longilinea sp.]